jgi:hypothetical protein
MRDILILTVAALLLSCGFNQPKSVYVNTMTTSDSIDLQNIRQLKVANAAQYRGILDKLDPADLVSLDAAESLLKNCVADTLSRDSMFVVFTDFLNQLTGSYLESNESITNQLEHSTSDQTFNAINTNLKAHGIRLNVSDGTFTLEPETSYLLTRFGPLISAEYKEYLTLASKEEGMPFSKDGLILIPTDSLIARILTWEHFLNQYPGFISTRVVQDKYSHYLGALLAGLDNSRAFDQGTNQFNDSLKVSLESFVFKNSESQSAKIVTDYLDLLKRSDYSYSDKIDSFLLDKVYRVPIE